VSRDAVRIALIVAALLTGIVLPFGALVCAFLSMNDRTKPWWEQTQEDIDRLAETDEP